MKNYELITKNKIGYWNIPVFEAFGCKAVFFLRKGGKSKGEFRSLNLGLNTEDDAKSVLENRERAYEAAGLGPLKPVLGQQVHDSRTRIAGKKDSGRGWMNHQQAFPKTDAIMTNVPGLPLAVSYADCLPILVADEKGRGIAAIHAGWRGLIKGIIPKTIDKYRRKYNISVKDIWVTIGPGIGSKAFEIQSKTIRLLNEFDSSGIIFKKKEKKVFYDLKKAAKNELIDIGILEKKIIVIKKCTFCNENEYFSHRRDGKTGRMFGIVQINQ